MAEYTKVVTGAGIAKLTEIANAAGTLVLTAVEAGDGAIGAGDPAELTDIISSKQSFSVIDVRHDDECTPFIYFNLTNEGLAAGYLMREVGLYGRMQGDATDTLIMYFYAAADEDADFIPAPEGGAATIQTWRVQIAQAAGLTAAVTVDNSTVFLALDRWADHLEGGGGVDQHPVATGEADGLMSAEDKSNLDQHINPAAPTSGSTVHASATEVISGFMSAADKSKLNGIQAGAQVNAPGFWKIRVTGNDGVEEGAIEADQVSDTFAIVGGNYIDIVTAPQNDTMVISAVNITPASHIGSRGAQHANATTTEAGFESAADKTKLDGIQAGAEVNQNTFAKVKVGATTIEADAKQDTLELIAGSDIVLTPNAAGDSVSIALAATHAGAGGAVHAAATGAAAGFMSAADKSVLDLLKPYYTLRSNFGNVALADILGHAQTFPNGSLDAPKGGIMFSGSRDITYTVVLEMRVNNVTANPITKTLQIGVVDDQLHYQIDAGAITQLVANPAQNSTGDITIPAGTHTVRFYLKNTTGSSMMLAIADWLDNNVQWAAGGVYY